MRTAAFGVALSLLLIPASLEAGPRTRFKPIAPVGTLTFQRLPDDPGRVSRLLDRIRERKTATAVTPGDRLSPDAVFLDVSLPYFIIPAAGSLAGGGGTFFRSDVTFANYADGPQQILVIWLERGVDGTSAPTFLSTLPEGPLTIREYVASLGLSGLGSLMVFAADAAGEPDFENGNIDGFSRIWTNQPGASGTVSQPFPAMSDFSLFGEFEGIALGLRQDDEYRTNAGVVNLDVVAHTFDVTVFGENGFTEFTINVPALSMQQVAIPAGNHGALALSFIPDVDEVDFGWIAYGTSVDNRTGDGWVANASLVSDFEE